MVSISFWFGERQKTNKFDKQDNGEPYKGTRITSYGISYSESTFSVVTRNEDMILRCTSSTIHAIVAHSTRGAKSIRPDLIILILFIAFSSHKS